MNRTFATFFTNVRRGEARSIVKGVEVELKSSATNMDEYRCRYLKSTEEAWSGVDIARQKDR